MVSILIPIYCVEKYVERCVRSVFEQTYSDLEIIIVNDCTPDSSIKIIESVLSDYPSRMSQVKFIHHTFNRGLGAARNTAIDNCNGEFVTHVDSDDWIEPDMVELLMGKQEETNADIITCKSYIHRNGEIIEHFPNDFEYDKYLLLSKLLRKEASCTIWHRLIRKRLYTDYNIRCDERTSRAEDWQVFPRLLYYANKTAGVNKFLYHYNKDNPSSLSWQNDINKVVEGAISRRIISSFFANKADNWARSAAVVEIVYLHKLLNQYCKQGNKSNFSTIAKLLQETDSSYWDCIGWNKPIKQLIERNYSLYRLSLPLREVRRRFTNMVAF